MILKPPVAVAIEDEQNYLDEILEAAADLGFRVEGYENADDGWQAIEAALSQDELGIVITDLRLPGDPEEGPFRGYQVIADTFRRSPATPIALYTSYPDDYAAVALNSASTIPGFSVIRKQDGGLDRLVEWMRFQAKKLIPIKTHSFNTDQYTRNILEKDLERVVEFGQSVIFYGETGTGKSDIAFRFGARVSPGLDAPQYVDLSVVRPEEFERYLFGEIRESSTREMVLETGSLLRASGITSESIIVGQDNVEQFLEQHAVAADEQNTFELSRIGRSSGIRRPVVVDNLQLLPYSTLHRLFNSFLKHRISVNGDGAYEIGLKSFLLGTFTLRQGDPTERLAEIHRFAKECEVSLIHIPSLRQLSSEQLSRLIVDVAEANEFKLTQKAIQVLISAFRPSLKSSGNLVREGNLRSLQAILRVAYMSSSNSGSSGEIGPDHVNGALDFYHETESMASKVLVDLHDKTDIEQQFGQYRRQVIQSEFQDALEAFGVSVNLPVTENSFAILCREDPERTAKALAQVLMSAPQGKERTMLFEELVFGITHKTRAYEYLEKVIDFDIFRKSYAEVTGETNSVSLNSIGEILGYDDDATD